MNELKPKDGDVIAVWFSCGAASAVAAKLTVEKYGQRCDVRIVNNPVVEEDADNRRFLNDVSAWIGREIEIAVNPAHAHCSAVEVWRHRRYMSNVAGQAPCTYELKKGARFAYEKTHRIDWHVLGFTADEQRRYDRFAEFERANTLPILIERNITKQDCFMRLHDAGIELPRVYKQGYPNANCLGCVKASSPTYWNLVREKHPQVFAERAAQSRELGARLVRVKGQRIFLDELAPDAVGGDLKTMESECGIFCLNFDSEGNVCD